MTESDCGKVTEVKDIQPIKAAVPMVVSAQFSGKDTEIKSLQ